ncbi:MAG: glycosyltransferase family A protein [Pseudomonadota bacterium]
MRIAIGAITRRRPQMFADLLASFAAMRRPAGTEIIFVFAENDRSPSVTPQIEAFRQTVPETVLFELEPRRGIPMARNKVLDMALGAGADLLTFVDDDEVVRADWLETMVAGFQARGLDLAGGPVRLTETSEAMTFWNRAVYAHLIYRAKKRNATRAAAVDTGKDHLLNIYTNNWALRLDTQRRLGVRFDERLQDTGGSDTRFSLDMKAAGARIGWIPEAWVEEPTPTKRLGFGYHYSRARDQATNAVMLSGRSKLNAFWHATARFLEAVVAVPLLPFTGSSGAARAVFKLGMAVGHVRGSFGRQSHHYDPAAAHFHAEVES